LDADKQSGLAPKKSGRLGPGSLSGLLSSTNGNSFGKAMSIAMKIMIMKASFIFYFDYDKGDLGI
jgi:hypothetical protein